jgi:hypothetical protein
MKLSDPFGRMENRNQLGYESMRDAMRKGGISTPEAALNVVEQSQKRAQQYILIGLAILLLITLVSPTAMPVTIALGLLMVVFIIKSTVNGKRYIKRYIDEAVS